MFFHQELEALKTELEDSLDTTAAVQDLRAKREDELKDLKVTIDKNQKTYESQVADMRTKHQQQMEQFNEELENVRKVGCVVLLPCTDSVHTFCLHLLGPLILT